MQVNRRRQVESSLQSKLPNRTRQQVGTADHIGDPLVGIIDDGRKVIAVQPVAAPDDHIAVELGGESDLAEASVQHAKHRQPAQVCAQRRVGRIASAAPAVTGATWLASARKIAARAITVKQRQAARQCGFGLRVARPAIALPLGLVRRVETERTEGSEDRVFVLRTTARRIEIVDAQ